MTTEVATTDTTLFPADAAGAADAGAGASPAGDAKPAADTTNPADTQAAAAADAAKPAEDGKPADGSKPDDAKPEVPEAYAEFKAPEGYELDQGLLEQFTPKFKEWGLSQDQAQDLLNLAPKLVDATVEKTTAAVLEAVGLKDRATWAQQVREDKVIGGEKVAENVAIARRGADALFSAETRDFLKKSGLGNHPALVRDMHRFGQTLSEDGFVPGGKNATPKTAQSYFDKSQMNP